MRRSVVRTAFPDHLGRLSEHRSNSMQGSSEQSLLNDADPSIESREVAQLSLACSPHCPERRHRCRGMQVEKHCLKAATGDVQRSYAPSIMPTLESGALASMWEMLKQLILRSV